MCVRFLSDYFVIQKKIHQEQCIQKNRRNHIEVNDTFTQSRMEREERIQKHCRYEQKVYESVNYRISILLNYQVVQR